MYHSIRYIIKMIQDNIIGDIQPLRVFCSDKESKKPPVPYFLSSRVINDITKLVTSTHGR